MKTEKQREATVVGTVLSFVGTLLRWHGHALVYVALAALLLFSAIVLSLRYWLLPDIAQYREAIASSISQAAGQRITIGKIEAGWDGLRPRFALQDVQVYDQQGHPALYLTQIENTLSWWTLFLGEARFHSMTIDQPNVVVRREANGLIFVAGIAVNQPEKESGFADWLLKQDQIRVRDAVILWMDNQRQAPPLVLSNVGLRLENHGRRHLFGVRATPPGVLAAPLDFRGNVVGKTLRKLEDWRGTLYARLDYADLEAWRKWVTYPFALQQGNGAVQLWLGFDSKRVKDVTGDVRLGGVKMRLASDLPELNLKTLTGRVGWTYLADGYDFQGKKLHVVTREGLAVGPSSFKGHLRAAAGGRQSEGAITVDNLPLTPLLALSNDLPLGQEVRQKLEALRPRGSLRDLTLSWEGDWHAPQKYNAKGQFVNFGINPYQKLPGLSGISGSVDANEEGGALSLNSPGSLVELRDVFREPLMFDALIAQASWKIRKGRLDLKLANVSFANAHLAGSVYGSYQTSAGVRGQIDLTGNLTRADARYVGRYIPLVVGQNTRSWLDRGLLAGTSDDVHLQLKGDLADFPFVDGKKGIFQVTAKVSGGILDYETGWPRIENIAADLLFKGKQMEINASKATIFGVSLQKVRARIPDLEHDETLLIDGEAKGPTNDFVQYINQSPVSQMIGNFTQGARAAGNGMLVLKLQMPLNHSKDTLVAGSYQFTNNKIMLANEIPALDKVNGKLSFTGSTIKTQNISGQMLGGPVNVQADTGADGAIHVTAQGRVNLPGLRKSISSPWTKYFNGAADWRGLITIRNLQADVTIDSTLQGLASDLPFPFAKPAAVSVPLHFERKYTGQQQDLVSLSYGKLFSAKFQRRTEGDNTRVEQGAISFGATEAKLTNNGVWANGTLPYLNLDQWRGILNQDSTQGEMLPTLPLAGLNVAINTLDAYGRRFNDLRLNASNTVDGWQAKLSSREMTGDVNWDPVGRGKIIARLKNLVVPEPSPSVTAGSVASSSREMPALDIVADNFELKRRKLGKLEVSAVQQGADWKIETLTIANPDMVLQMDGLWQAWLVHPQTSANLKLDVKDIGKFLARFGFPDSVKRGSAKLDGKLMWAGGPSDMNFPSLTGNLTLVASNGQFLKIDPGIGKLLGILSLQALPRRITLDFRDVFSEGFAFNNISGSMRIERGLLSSNDFTMEGPAAVISMSGETDIARETQKLHVKVIPVLGEGVSVAGAFLGGPVVGLTSLLLQKLLKDPLGHLASYEYNITGTWSDPVVTKIRKGGAAAATE